MLRRISSLAKRRYGTIGDAGGAFAKKGTAQEEKFIHDHEVEVIKALKEKLIKEQQELQKKIDDTNTKLKEKGVEIDEVSPESLGYSTTGSGLGGPIRAGGGSFAKKEAAIEEQYFRKRDQEHLKDLKDEYKKKH